MKSGYVKSLAVAAWAAWGMVPVVVQAQLVDLGVATGYAINNTGQVVLSTGIYSNGTTTPLPALPGQTTPAVGAAINASGQVAGSAPTSTPNSSGGNFDFTVPVEFSSGTLTILQSPIEYADNISSEAYATGINSSAEIVGYSVSPDIGPVDVLQGYDYGGFIYANGKLVSLPSSGLPYTNMPAGINDSSQITGAISTGSNTLDAYIYDYGTGTLTDLGQGAGYAINNAGQVTGTLDKLAVKSSGSGTITGSYAFLYSNGTTTNLGTLAGADDGTGSAINSTGQVVGGSGGHAFFYNGAMNDLNTLISATDPLKPYVTLTSAVGINDSLLILANGVDSRTNLGHAYLYQASFLQLAPMALNFPLEAVGETSPPQSVTVTNSGTTSIPFGTAYVNGDFSLRADNCGTSLAPGGQCRLDVVFAPKVIGVLTGALTIPSAGANYQVPLFGVASITAKISASSSTATVGQPLTLTWTVSAGSTCTAAGSSTNAAWTASNPPFTGTVPVSGKQTLTEIVNGTVTYTLNCTAPGVAAVSVSASVVWNWLPVTASISASPAAILAGQAVTVTWSSSNATSCSASGGGENDGWPGSKATSGSQTVTERSAPATGSTLTYTITCTSSTSGLTAQMSTSVVVSWPSVTATISASPASIAAGGTVTLTWSSSNATGCTATGGGADDNWPGAKATSGSQTVTEAIALDASVILTFGITCNSTTSGLSGKASASVTENPASAASIQIAPAVINFGTEAVGSTSKSQSVTLTNSGTTAIPLTAASVTSNFSLQIDGCSASLAAGAHCTLVVAFAPTVAGALTGTLTVPSDGANYQVALSGVATTVATEPPVTVTLGASPTTITAGQSTTLTWKSSNATTCTATGGGTDDNWAGSKATSGSETVTEAAALDTSSVILTFGINCNSTASGLSDKASVNVTENQAPATSGGAPAPTSSGGGGGALSPLSLAFLAGILALRRVRRMQLALVSQKARV